jgi:hypothetical protein
VTVGLALAGIALLLQLGGCGGGGSSDASGAEATEKSASTAAKQATEAGNGSSQGDESAPPSASGQPLTKREFIRLGDQICRRGGTKIVTELQKHKLEYGRGFGKQPTQKQNEEGLVDLVLPVIQSEAEEIAALEPPAGDEQEVAAIVRALETGVAETEAKPSLAGSVKGNPLGEASKLSQEYGFKLCGS